MPVPSRVRPESNIWIASGDGDLERVRELIEGQSISPNAFDENTYSPMHAAASYGQLEVLEYLVSQGGNVNLADSDGDTPVYVVESVEIARWLVEHGAEVNRRNSEGQTPAEYLVEDFPEVAAYLDTLTSQSTAAVGAGADLSSAGSALSHQSPLLSSSQVQPSQHAQNQASEQLTSSLMQSVQDIMMRAEADGHDPDAELREVVERTVLEGVMAGYDLSTSTEEGRREPREREINGVSKRSRMDDGSGPS